MRKKKLVHTAGKSYTTVEAATKAQTRPRVYTEEEIRDKFLAYARSVARYWVEQAPANYTPLQRTEGAIFSLLVALDGETLAVPGFKVIPNPHPDDKAYYIAHGENWYPDDVDIAGCLHERFFKRD